MASNFSSPFAASDPTAIESLAYAGTDISHTAFQVTIGVFFSLSIISFFIRLALRSISLRALHLDDAILGFGAVCLIAATGLVYAICDDFFLADLLQRNPVAAFQLDQATLNHIINELLPYTQTFLCLVWTATFAVKFSFLALFRQLTNRVVNINRYFWAVTLLSGVSWAFVMCEPFILCTSVGAQSFQCYGPQRQTLYVSLTSLVTALDVVTDILIVSFPFIILRRTTICIVQKLTLGAFLSLSLIMVVLAIIRCSKIDRGPNVDIVWEIFWQYMEAAVAVLMASLATFRTLFTSTSHRRQPDSPGVLSPQSPRGWSFVESWIVRRKRYGKQSDGGYSMKQTEDNRGLIGMSREPQGEFVGVVPTREREVVLDDLEIASVERRPCDEEAAGRLSLQSVYGVGRAF